MPSPSKFRLNTYLNPREIAPERRRMMYPDEARTIKTVEVIPDWYWLKNDRWVAQSTNFLLDDLWLVTYFTCEELPDGTMFDTVYSLKEDHSQWFVIARAATLEEAFAQHATLRHAWWAGDVHLRNLHERSGIKIPAPGLEQIPPLPVGPPAEYAEQWREGVRRKEAEDRAAAAAAWPFSGPVPDDA